VPLLAPDAAVFCSSKGGCGLECYQKAVAGNLFLLRGGVLSMNKPVRACMCVYVCVYGATRSLAPPLCTCNPCLAFQMTFLPRESIAEIVTARSGNRFFDLIVVRFTNPFEIIKTLISIIITNTYSTSLSDNFLLNLLPIACALRNRLRGRNSNLI
jgi:hypothetical protein